MNLQQSSFHKVQAKQALVDSGGGGGGKGTLAPAASPLGEGCLKELEKPQGHSYQLKHKCLQGCKAKGECTALRSIKYLEELISWVQR